MRLCSLSRWVADAATVIRKTLLKHGQLDSSRERQGGSAGFDAEMQLKNGFIFMQNPGRLPCGMVHTIEKDKDSQGYWKS